MPRADARRPVPLERTNDFSAASMLRLGASVIVPLGRRFDVEAGYAQWVWGRSAREYLEPYFSIGYRL
ncbi:MAG: hypothetical protein M3S32_10020 [Acidobacteriota bacterium]|nr:hypothetical protein [Acidobacteriota bacterium]